MKTIIISIFLNLLLSSAKLPCQGVWHQTNGPSGGYAACFAQDSLRKLYVITGNLHLSIDQGETWAKVDLPFYGIMVISFHPNGATFAGTYDGKIYKSTNQGLSWQQLIVPIPYYAYVTSIVINSSGYIFAATNDAGIIRSTNNGLNWTNPISGEDIRSLAIDRQGFLYAGLLWGGLYRSVDNGSNWNRIAFQDTSIYSIVFNSSNTLFVCAEATMFKSTDGGLSWVQSNSGLTPCQDIKLFVSTKDYLFAGSRFGLYLSTDDGNTWLTYNNGLNGQRIISFFETQHHLIFIGSSGKAVNRSTDGGHNWTLNNIGIKNASVQSLAIHPSGTIFAGAQNNGIFFSTNRGANWIPTIIQESEEWSEYLSMAVANNGDIFASLDNKLYLSTDIGLTWNLITPGYMTEILEVVVSSQGHIFLAEYGFNVHRSTNYGLSWSHLQVPNSNVYSLAINKNGVLICSTMDGVFRSTNNGDNWIFMTSLVANTVAFSQSGAIFLGTWEGVYRSTDNGVNWVYLGFSNDLIQKVVVDKMNRVYVLCGKSSGLYISTNQGNNWLNSGLEHYPLSLVLDSNGYIFVGTASKSVYCRSDSTISVKKLGNSIPTEYILYQNYPNPFNPVTKIRFSVPLNKGGERGLSVKLIIYDLLGREIATLVNDKLQPGTYEVEWDGTNYPSGVYFYILTAGDDKETKKMVLVR